MKQDITAEQLKLLWQQGCEKADIRERLMEGEDGNEPIFMVELNPKVAISIYKNIDYSKLGTIQINTTNKAFIQDFTYSIKVVFGGYIEYVERPITREEFVQMHNMWTDACYRTDRETRNNIISEGEVELRKILAI